MYLKKVVVFLNTANVDKDRRQQYTQGPWQVRWDDTDIVYLDERNEWLLINANSVIFHLYHDQNMLIFNEMCLLFLLDDACLAEK